MKENLKKVRLLEGIALILLGIILIIPKNNSIEASSSFESEPVEVIGLNTGELDPNKVPNKIVVPKAGIDLEVNQSPIVNGYWEVFDDKAGWGEGSGLPGEAGNQVIFAHARDGLFGDLNKVETGDHIYVTTNENWYEYEIKEIKEVYPNNTEVIEPSEDEKLTLYTCSGYRDSKRLIVIADRI